MYIQIVYTHIVKTKATSAARRGKLRTYIYIYIHEELVDEEDGHHLVCTIAHVWIYLAGQMFIIINDISYRVRRL